MKSYCRKCAKRIKRGLACFWCLRPICYTCDCDCPRVLAIKAEKIATGNQESLSALGSLRSAAPK